MSRATPRSVTQILPRVNGRRRTLPQPEDQEERPRRGSSISIEPYYSLEQMQRRLSHAQLNWVVAGLREGELAYFRDCGRAQRTAARFTAPVVLHWTAAIPKALMVAVLRYFWYPERMACEHPRDYDYLNAFFERQPYRIIKVSDYVSIYVADIAPLLSHHLARALARA